MRSLNREKQLIYISQPLPKEEIKDENGDSTGTYANVWDEPVELHLNLKPVTDELERQAFGTDVKSILKVECTPFDIDGYSFIENSIAWIGVTPNGVLRDDGTAKMNHNYVVEQILNTGGQIKVYFKKIAGATKA